MSIILDVQKWGETNYKEHNTCMFVENMEVNPHAILLRYSYFVFVPSKTEIYRKIEFYR